MDNSAKFKRSLNFSSKEESILLDLVKKYKDDIECKKTDTNTNKIKANAWMKLTEEYNMICGESHRNLKHLRNKYENIKKRTKQKYAHNKFYIEGTGGGPAKDVAVTTADNDILEIIGTQLTGHESKYDDDAVTESIIVTYEMEQDNDESEQEDLIGIEEKKSTNYSRSYEEKCVASTSNENRNWLSCDTANLLKTPKSSQLIRKPKSSESEALLAKSDGLNNTTKLFKKLADEYKSDTISTRRRRSKESLGYKLEEWAASKISLSEIQKQCFIKEHALKIKLFREKHEKQVEIMEKEHEEKMQILKLEKEMILKKLSHS